ncbi:MAG: hypothetical protein NT129_00740 [Candidatus Aenigmarchaeota archaeon]|jgi:uncharacterized BrkB/YihY/UPF0761 family membrane protein|nr:hypothetical protein [Candidatus Aenigmarchaeota archaeon]
MNKDQWFMTAFLLAIFASILSYSEYRYSQSLVGQIYGSFGGTSTTSVLAIVLWLVFFICIGIGVTTKEVNEKKGK